MKRLLQMLFFILPFASFATGETDYGTITGKIITTDNQPAASVTVVLNGNNKATITTDDGSFTLSHIATGTYSLQVSFTGYETLTQSVTVTKNSITTVSLQLQLSNKELQEVIVRTNANSVVQKESPYVARMPLRNLENPQSYAVVNKELLKQQSITDYASALRAIPGLANATQDPYLFSGVYMRGFLTQSFVRNGLYTYNITGGDPQSVERIEAIKGPSGTLFGTAGISYGGLLNRVTKRPFDATAVEAGLTLGGYNLNRLTVDVNTPLNADHSALFRINAALNREESFQDIGFSHTYMVAPVLSYKVNDRLNVLLEAEFNSNNQLAPFYFYSAGGITAKDIRDLKLDYFKTYSSADLTHKPSTQTYYAATVNYKLSNDWQLTGLATASDIASYGSNVFPNFIDNNRFYREVYDFNFNWHTLNVQANVNGTFNIGHLRNKFLAGLDYTRYQLFPVTGGEVFAADTVNLATGTIPVLNVNKIRTNYDYTFIYKAVSNTYAAYAADVLNITDRLNILLSLRYNKYEDGGGYYDVQPVPLTGQYKQGSFSPKVGATYQLIENKLTVFANYQNGFQNVAPNPQASKTFKPEHADQKEVGLKFELLGGRLSSTLSYYDIEVKNKVRADPANPLMQIQDGTQRSKGVDFDIVAAPVAGLTLTAGYGYNDSRFTKADKTVEGKRPLGVPMNVGNLWASYTLSKGKAKGLGAGFGVNYNGQLYFNDANTFSIPHYTLLKATMFYNVQKFRLALTSDNLSNQRFWDFHATPQMPRRILASLSIKL